MEHYHVYRPEVALETGAVTGYVMIDGDMNGVIKSRSTANNYAKYATVAVTVAPRREGEAMHRRDLAEDIPSMRSPDDQVYPGMVRRCDSEDCSRFREARRVKRFREQMESDPFFAKAVGVIESATGRSFLGE